MVFRLQDSDLADSDNIIKPYWGTTQLVILQPTPFCNLDCRYCYLTNRSHSSVMSKDVIEAIAQNVCSSLLIHPCVELSFHSGEPLAAGLGWFASAMKTLTASWAAGVQATYSVQTNATLIDARWAQLFVQYGFRVGVSLDGPAHLNDINRRTRRNRGTHARVIAGLRVLQQFGVPFGILCVLSDNNIEHASELYCHFSELRPRVVAFNVEELEGFNSDAHFQGKNTPERVRCFLSQYVQLCARDGFPHEVREITQFAKSFDVSMQEIEVKSATSTPFRILTIDHLGDFSTFSPELADMKSPHYGDFVLGNVQHGRPEAVVDRAKLISLLAEIDSGVAVCKATCEFFRICGGGAPSNKLSEFGSFAVGETHYCRNTVQAVAHTAADHLIHSLSAQYP